MLRPLDVVVALRLSNGNPHSGESWTYPQLSSDLAMSPSVVHGALRRLREGRVWLAGDRAVDRARLARFLIYGLPVVAPATLGEETRGIPTAWAAEPLSAEFAEGSDVPVWPDASGKVRGRALQPLHHGVIEAARRSPALARQLALVDALRLGGGARIERRAALLLARELRVPDLKVEIGIP